MQLVFQFLLIAAISFIGELFSLLLPLPVPGSVYGLVILLVLLCTGIVKLHQVERAGDFMLQIMPLLFIGPCVSILSVVGGIAGSLLGIAVVCLISTVLVMVVTGLTAQAILQRREKRDHE